MTNIDIDTTQDEEDTCYDYTQDLIFDTTLQDIGNNKKEDASSPPLILDFKDQQQQEFLPNHANNDQNFILP